MNDKHVEILRSCPLFCNLSEDFLRLLSTAVKELRFKARGGIFAEGDECNGFYIVEKGLVKVFKINKEGKEMILHLARPSSSFGEAALFSGTSFPAWAEAVEPTTTLFIRKDGILRILNDKPQIVMKMLSGLSQWIRNLVQRIEDLTLSDSEERLQRFLASRCPEGENPPVEISLGARKAVVASLLGITPETFSRLLLKLSASGFIKISGNKITLLKFS